MPSRSVWINHLPDVQHLMFLKNLSDNIPSSSFTYKPLMGQYPCQFLASGR
jgi:hypothetical protein